MNTTTTTSTETNPSDLRGPPNSLRLVDVIDQLYSGEEVFFRYVKTVGDLMSDLRYLTLDANIEKGIAFLNEHGSRHIVVLEVEELQKGETRPPKKELIGVVSQRDIARCVSPNVGTLMETDEDKKALKQPLGTVVTRKPKTVDVSTPFIQAVQVMVSNKIDCLPVVASENDGTPLGIFTTHDVIKCFVRFQVLRRTRTVKSKNTRLIDFVTGGDTSQRPTELLVDSLFGRLSDIMRDEVVTVGLNDPVRRAMALMQERRFRHLPVVDDRGKIKGIVSDRDVLKSLPPLDPQAIQRLLAEQGRDGAGFRDKLFHVDPADKSAAAILKQPVSSIMSGSPVVKTPLTPASEVAELFCNHKLGCVPIVAEDASGVVGIVTQTDILCAILALARLAKV